MGLLSETDGIDMTFNNDEAGGERGRRQGDGG